MRIGKISKNGIMIGGFDSQLVKACQKVDKTEESVYGYSFDDDSQRLTYLFKLY